MNNLSAGKPPVKCIQCDIIGGRLNQRLMLYTDDYKDFREVYLQLFPLTMSIRLN